MLLTLEEKSVLLLLDKLYNWSLKTSYWNKKHVCWKQHVLQTRANSHYKPFCSIQSSEITIIMFVYGFDVKKSSIWELSALYMITELMSNLFWYWLPLFCLIKCCLTNSMITWLCAAALLHLPINWFIRHLPLTLFSSLKVNWFSLSL